MLYLWIVEGLRASPQALRHRLTGAGRPSRARRAVRRTRTNGPSRGVTVSRTARADLAAQLRERQGPLAQPAFPRRGPDGDDSRRERHGRAGERRGRARRTRGRVAAGVRPGPSSPSTAAVTSASSRRPDLATDLEAAVHSVARWVLRYAEVFTARNLTADRRLPKTAGGAAIAIPLDMPRPRRRRARRYRRGAGVTRARARRRGARRAPAGARAWRNRARQRAAARAGRGVVGHRRSDAAVQLALSVARAAARNEAGVAQRPAAVAAVHRPRRVQVASTTRTATSRAAERSWRRP